MSSKNDRVAHAMLQFRLFRIPHPRLVSIADEIETLRSLGRQSRELWKSNGCKGSRVPQKFLTIIGPSGSGKSTAIKHYLEQMILPDDPEIRPMVHITLSPKATTKQLAVDILEEYACPSLGNASKLLGQASNAIEQAETDVLVLDEIHHLRSFEGEVTAWDVTETIKRMLIRGACPLILIGTERAKPLLVGNRQFLNRTFEPIFLDPLDVTKPDEWVTFVEHCGGFDLKLVEHGIFTKFSGLMDGDVPACMYEVSGGVIGVASNIFEVAALDAMKGNTTRGPADSVDRGHLERAVDVWARALGVTVRNPFRDGIADLKQKRA